MKTNPSHFTDKPWNSVFQKCEHETIARNIMVILSRTGDTFRPLSWEEYSEERKKDGQFSEGEKQYFESVINYCSSPEQAGKFSKSWSN